MIPSLLSADFVPALGWTLIQFLWQGLAFAALLGLILPLCRSPRARHNWSLSILVMMALTPVITFLVIRQPDTGIVPIAALAGTPDMTMVGGNFATTAIHLPWIDSLVPLWLAGIAVLSVRALGGWYLAETLRWRGTMALPADLLRRCQALQRRLALAWPVQFLQSSRVTVPVVIGWFRPVVLLPVATIAGLPMQQLEALILHELAHIRRLDTFINLLLVAVETILFYHPAVWWVSRNVRREREHCCDDMAVSACGDAVIYVEALASLASSEPTPALGANGGVLKARVTRLLEGSPQGRKFSLSAMVGLLFLSLVFARVAIAQNNVPPGPQDFAIRVVDESVTNNAQQGPTGDDRVAQLSSAGARSAGALWLKREGEITGAVLVEAHAQTDSRTGRPTISFRFTPVAEKQFAALTIANVGHRLAIVVSDKVISAPVVLEPILGGAGQISGDFGMDEAQALAAQMMGDGHAAPPAAP